MPTPLASAFIRVRPDSDTLKREVERDFDSAGTAAGAKFGKSFSDQVRRSSDTQKTGSEAGKKFGGAFADSLKVAAGVAIAKVGEIAAQQLSSGFEQALDISGAQGLFQAQLGVSSAQAQKIGGVAGHLFSQAYGENMEEVRGAITSVIQNMDGMRTASSAALEQMSARAITTGQVLGEDVGAVTRTVAQIMRTGLAPDAKTAFDILTRGAQLGLNSSEDLLDTFKEYGTQFRKLGIDGKTALGLLSQGLKAGARDTDTVADALKEFSIRAVDGTKLSASGFKALGLNAKDMAAQIGKGGTSASKGLDTVLDRLRNVKDPVKQGQIAVALFGTKAEDLGKALFALDPSKASSGMTGLAGATDKASKAIGDTPQSKFTAFKRGIQTNIVNYIATTVIPAVQKVGKAFSDMGISGGGAAAVAVPLVGIGIGARVAAAAVGTVATGIRGVVSAGKGIGTAAQGASRMAQGFRSADVAGSAFSGRLGTIGGRLRTVFDAGISGAKTFGSSVVSAGAAAGRGLASAGVAAGRAAASAATATASYAAMGARALWAGIQTAYFAAQTLIASAATKIWSAVQLAFNVIMSANPITLVVIALVALGAAVYLAYTRFAFFRNAVNAVFGFLRTAVVSTINFVRDHWRLIISILFGPLGIAVALVTRYWNQIRNVTVGAVTGAVNFVRSHWRLIISILLGPLGLAIALVTKYWGTIRTRIVSAVTNTLNWVRTHWRQILTIMATPITAVISMVTSRWQKIKDLTSSLAGSVLGKIRSMMTGARNAFNSGVNAIGSAWNRIRNAAKSPINFVIGTVYNRGIVGLWNKVMGWLHLPGSLRLGTLPLLASGGPMPVRPGVHNRPTAIVGEGDPNHPEYVIPTDPKYRSRAQALWAAAGQHMQMMDIGGILGGIKKAAGKVVNVGKTAFNLVTNPGKVWDQLVKAIPSANGLRTSPFGVAAAEMPKLILSHARTYAIQFFKAFADGFGGGGNTAVVNAARKYIGTPYLWGGTGFGGIDCSGLTMQAWEAAHRNITRTTYTQRRALKTIPRPRPGAVGQPHPGHTYLASRVQGNKTWVVEAAHSGTRVSEHSLTRNTPWWGYPPGLALGGIIKRLGEGFVAGSKSAIAAKMFGLAGDPGGVLPGYGSINKNLFPGGGSSGNAAMDLVGALGFKPLFDRGGFGTGWPFSSRDPEPVLTGTQWADIHTLAKRGSRPEVAVHLHGITGIPIERQVTNAIDNLYTLRGRW